MNEYIYKLFTLSSTPITPTSHVHAQLLQTRCLFHFAAGITAVKLSSSTYVLQFAPSFSLRSRLLDRHGSCPAYGVKVVANHGVSFLHHCPALISQYVQPITLSILAKHVSNAARLHYFYNDLRYLVLQLQYDQEASRHKQDPCADTEVQKENVPESRASLRRL